MKNNVCAISRDAAVDMLQSTGVDNERTLLQLMETSRSYFAVPMSCVDRMVDQLPRHR